MKTKKFNVAVLGASGAVGNALLSVLAERNFPIENLYLLSSARSAGKTISFKGEAITLVNADTFDWSKADIGLFSAGGSVSKVYAPLAASKGCVIIDNTSEFRYQDDIPLVVPEVNADAVAEYKNHGIIANPNCSTIQMLVALKPLHDAAGIKHINVCTYQAVSGSGQSAIEELMSQTRSMLGSKKVEIEVYPKQIAFNAIPQIDSFQENGYTREEMKMVWETQKIMDANIQVNPTTVRIPVVSGHSEALHIETERKITATEAKSLLEKASGIVVIDERKDGGYPTAFTDAVDSDAVFVGRIRDDISKENGLNLWVVSDNLRKGAATNSVQIAEVLIQNYL